MAYTLRALTALAKDMSLIPNTHIRHFTTTCDSGFRGYDVLFLSSQMHTHTNKNKTIFKNPPRLLFSITSYDCSHENAVTTADHWNKRKLTSRRHPTVHWVDFLTWYRVRLKIEFCFPCYLGTPLSQSCMLKRVFNFFGTFSKGWLSVYESISGLSSFY